MTTTGAANIPRVNWMTSEPITVATYIFDAYTYSGPGFTTPLLAFFTYRNDLVAANTGVRFFFASNGSIRVEDGGAFVTASNQWTHNTVNHVEVTVYEDQTYSLTINGVTVSYIVNEEEKTRFSFQTTDSMFAATYFQFSIADSGNSKSRVFVDNIQIIPEPGTSLLLGAAFLFGFTIRRKRSLA